VTLIASHGASMSLPGPAILPSVDITAELDELLGKRGAPRVLGKARLDTDALEGFLKEAYRIVRF